jgi:hypothetical protein
MFKDIDRECLLFAAVMWFTAWIALIVDKSVGWFIVFQIFTVICLYLAHPKDKKRTPPKQGS